jgi:hypothetical protein
MGRVRLGLFWLCERCSRSMLAAPVALGAAAAGGDVSLVNRPFLLSE